MCDASEHAPGEKKRLSNVAPPVDVCRRYRLIADRARCQPACGELSGRVLRQACPEHRRRAPIEKRRHKQLSPQAMTEGRNTIPVDTSRRGATMPTAKRRLKGESHG